VSLDGLLIVAVALGAAIGAPLRFLLERGLERLAGPALPWGTLAANLGGSALAGAVIGASRAGSLPPGAVLLLATGFCGALTTFSGFAAQVFQLTLPRSPDGPVAHAPGSPRDRSRASWGGAAYALVSMVLGVGLASLTFALASGLV